MALAFCLAGAWCAPVLRGQTALPTTQPSPAASSSPSTQPAPAGAPAADASDFIISQVRVQTLAGFTYLYRSFDTSFQTMSQPVGQAIADMEKAIAAGKLHPVGPMIFIYHDMRDPYKPFTLDLGFPVPEGSAAPEGYQVGKVEPFKCATVLFSGPLSKVPDAFNKLMGSLAPMGLHPTRTTREFYLYWEDPNSPNNVLQIQVGLE